MVFELMELEGILIEGGQKSYGFRSIILAFMITSDLVDFKYTPPNSHLIQKPQKLNAV